MNWKEAVKFMENGGMVTRKHWLVSDFLFMENGVLMCDGMFPFLSLIGNTRGVWLEYKLK